MTYAASSEPSHRTTAATSAVLANRPSGICPRYSACLSSGRTAVISVSTKPGATTFEVIDRLPSSRASERAIPTSPDLLAA